jgi:hypothetical protein
MSQGQAFETDHLYLAAFLVCRGHELVAVVGGEGGRFRFGFPDTAEVRSSAGNFMAGGLVDARQFAFELLKLKKNIPRPSDTPRMRRVKNNAAHQLSFEPKA